MESKRAGQAPLRQKASATMARMNMPPYIPNSDEFGELQRFVDALYAHATIVDNVEVQVAAEMYDFDADLLEIISMLPSGVYERPRICDQFNSALAAHGWTQRFGTVE